MIDLDHNATTRLHPRVREAMSAFLGAGHGNPSSLHRTGQRARAALEEARGEVALALGARRLEVVFTSGGTEADNLAVLGVCARLRRDGRPCGILTSRLEHPAVADAATRLQAEGTPVVWVEPDSRGRIDAGRVGALVADHPEVGLVSLAAANHELGNHSDVAGIVSAVRAIRPDVLVHTDAVQALGKIEVDFAAWDVDLLSVSAHKVFGPPGAGALVVREGLKLDARGIGGKQERGYRPGTEATLLLHGFGAAARVVREERAAWAGHVRPLRDRLRDGLLALGAHVHGDPGQHVGNTVSARFDGCDGQDLLMALDLEGVAVSTGAACSAGSLDPSPVLLALGLTPGEARGAVRFSLGPDNTEVEVDRVLELLPDLVGRARGARA